MKKYFGQARHDDLHFGMVALCLGFSSARRALIRARFKVAKCPRTTKEPPKARREEEEKEEEEEKKPPPLGQK